MAKADSERYINRELSWLEFNRRVLEEAQDDGVPPLERMKFLAITASNLDEFFMVRIGGLGMLVDRGVNKADESGRTPRQLLAELDRRVHAFVEDQYACLEGHLEPLLAKEGILRIRPHRLTAEQAQHLSRVFDSEIFPLLTPRAIDEEQEFPALSGLVLHLAVRLRRAAGGAEQWAVVGIPRLLPRLYTLPGEEGYRYVLIEDILELHLERLFPGMEITEHALFRITRNADMRVVEDLASDLMSRMQEVLVARRKSDGVRLELESGASAALRSWLMESLAVDASALYSISGPLMLSSFMSLGDAAGFEDLRNESWPPQPSPRVRPGASMFENIAQGDFTLYAPYESYDPVVRLVEEAAADPDVLAIKQILYRTSRKSPIVAALSRAAAAGKQVTAVVELKARFDEERNIEWAQALEKAGVQVIYGIRGLKTHAKICLIVRREAEGLRRYVHFGTGNYNEQTSRMYADVSLLSCHDDYGADASQFFNTITGVAQPAPYRRMEAAPLGLRARLMELIENEIERSRQGQDGYILCKINSLSDPDVIAALYKASQAGVRVDLLVRGICCLRPGIPGLSETIRVFSVVDRYLEHARLLYFRHGGEGRVFISSADWMQRNLDKRIELLVEVHDAACRHKLEQYLHVHLIDNVKARQLLGNGSYERMTPLRRQRPVQSQKELFAMARRAARSASDPRAMKFVPHRPPRS